MPNLPAQAGPAGPLVEQIRRQADFCGSAGAPLYDVLLRGIADDLAAGGPTADVLEGRLASPPGGVVELRLLGGLHRIVLTRRAPLLATYYRSVGGTAAPDGAWPVARDVLAAHTGELREALEIAPQTNETGRAVGLAVGLLAATAGMTSDGRGRDVRLLEVGASAGLNLLVDRFRVTAADGDPRHAWGPPGSPVDLTGSVHPAPHPSPPLPPSRWVGSADSLWGDRPVRIVEQRGCDLAPIDPRTPAGRLRLTSFVWPDHVERHRRLAAALALAAENPVPVDRGDAVDWLAEQLAAVPPDGALTVVWHSIFRQYLDAGAQAALAGVIEAARPRMPLVHLCFEFPFDGDSAPPELTLDGAVIATAPPHGVPLTLA